MALHRRLKSNSKSMLNSNNSNNAIPFRSRNVQVENLKMAFAAFVAHSKS